jgi:hypothetical protein
MAKKPYRTARQEHLADMLDKLQRRGRLTWVWDYDVPASRAIYWVERLGTTTQLLTQAAEELVQQECDTLGIHWLPVPHPGGETQRARILAQLAGTD